MANWLELDAVCSVLDIIKAAYNRRKAVRDKVFRHARFFFQISRALGKFKRGLLRARRKKAIERIKYFVRFKVRVWLKIQKKKHTRRIVKYLH